MALECDGCGNKLAYKISMFRTDEGDFSSWCDKCGSVGSTWTPDVYWPGHAYASEHVTDTMGNPITFESRRHKAEVMRQQGISEAGDMHHGSRYVPQAPQKKDSRPEVRQAIRTAMEQMKRKYK